MKRHTSPTLRKFARSRKLKLSWRIVDREGIEPELRGAYRVIKVGRACPIVISDARHDLPLGVLGDLGCVEMEEWLRRVQDENLLIAFVPRHLEQLLSEAGFPLSTAGSAFDDRMLEINGLKLYQVVDSGRRYLLYPDESSIPTMVEMLAWIGDGQPDPRS